MASGGGSRGSRARRLQASAFLLIASRPFSFALTHLTSAPLVARKVSWTRETTVQPAPPSTHAFSLLATFDSVPRSCLKPRVPRHAAQAQPCHASMNWGFGSGKRLARNGGAPPVKGCFFCTTTTGPPASAGPRSPAYRGTPCR